MVTRRLSISGGRIGNKKLNCRVLDGGLRLSTSRRRGQMKIPPRLLHISCNLLSQRIDRRKLELLSNALQKQHLDFGLRRQFNRMEIQKVGLDRERIGA